MGQQGKSSGTKLVGAVAVLAGLILLGLCLTQWSPGTGSTMGRALSDYNGGDRHDLSAFGSGQLRDTSQTAVEGLAGLFWLGIGVFLIKKAGTEPARRDRGRRG